MDIYEEEIEGLRLNLPAEKGDWSCPELRACLDETEEAIMANAPQLEEKTMEQFFDELFSREDTPTLAGRRVFESIHVLLSRMRYVPGSSKGRSQVQMTIHERAVNLAIPLIYGKQWSRHSAQILREHGIDHLDAGLIVSMARRHGKTVAISMLVAALVYCLRRNVTVAIFAQKVAVATALLKTVRRFLMQLDGAGARIKKFATTSSDGGCGKLEYKWGPSPLDISVVQAFPSGGDNNRGVIDADIFIFDELAHADVETLTIGVAPGLKRNDSILIGLSSPAREASNHMTKLLSYVGRDGRKVVQSLIIELKCEECRRLQREDCIHVQHENPHWLDPGRAELIRAIMSLDPGMYNQEMLGVSVDPMASCFPASMVDSCLRRRLVVREHVQFVFGFIDPSGGGDKSNTGIVFAAYTQDNTFVVS